MRQIKVLQRP